jgi:hypothetical protein
MDGARMSHQMSERSLDPGDKHGLSATSFAGKNVSSASLSPLGCRPFSVEYAYGKISVFSASLWPLRSFGLASHQRR